MALTVYKANIAYTPSMERFELRPGGYVAVEDGRVEGVYSTLPSRFKGRPVEDLGDRFLIPGFTDLHLHAAQYPNMGIGYDCELLPWIEKYTYPIENRCEDLAYSAKMFAALIKELWRFGITRCVIMAPPCTGAVDILMEQFIRSGLGCYVGKRHTDYKLNNYPCEDTDASLAGARYLITKYEGKSPFVRYMLNPSFAPGCTERMLEEVGRMAAALRLPVHSHLDENRNEVQLVARRFPHDPHYAGVYIRHGLFGDTPTVMAHCIYTTEDEVKAIRDRGVYVAHCIHSNLDLASGVMPLRRYLKEGIHVGLGSDIAGGHTLNMMDTIRAVIEASKTVFVQEESCPPITVSEAFYLATKGGGSFFGKVGSFEPGYVFDALVVDDRSLLNDYIDRSLQERLERFLYLGDDRQIIRRFVAGREIPEPVL